MAVLKVVCPASGSDRVAISPLSRHWKSNHFRRRSFVVRIRSASVRSGMLCRTSTKRCPVLKYLVINFPDTGRSRRKESIQEVTPQSLRNSDEFNNK